MYDAEAAVKVAVSACVTVITAVPSALMVTSPVVAFTSATSGLLDEYVNAPSELVVSFGALNGMPMRAMRAK